MTVYSPQQVSTMITATISEADSNCNNVCKESVKDSKSRDPIQRESSLASSTATTTTWSKSSASYVSVIEGGETPIETRKEETPSLSLSSSVEARCTRTEAPLPQPAPPQKNHCAPPEREPFPRLPHPSLPQQKQIMYDSSNHIVVTPALQLQQVQSTSDHSETTIQTNHDHSASSSVEKGRKTGSSSSPKVLLLAEDSNHTPEHDVQPAPQQQQLKLQPIEFDIEHTPLSVFKARLLVVKEDSSLTGNGYSYQQQSNNNTSTSSSNDILTGNLMESSLVVGDSSFTFDLMQRENSMSLSDLVCSSPQVGRGRAAGGSRSSPGRCSSSPTKHKRPSTLNRRFLVKSQSERGGFIRQKQVLYDDLSDLSQSCHDESESGSLSSGLSVIDELQVIERLRQTRARNKTHSTATTPTLPSSQSKQSPQKVPAIHILPDLAPPIVAADADALTTKRADSRPTLLIASKHPSLRDMTGEMSDKKPLLPARRSLNDSYHDQGGKEKTTEEIPTATKTSLVLGSSKPAARARPSLADCAKHPSLRDVSAECDKKPQIPCRGTPAMNEAVTPVAALNSAPRGSRPSLADFGKHPSFRTTEGGERDAAPSLPSRNLFSSTKHASLRNLCAGHNNMTTESLAPLSRSPFSGSIKQQPQSNSIQRQKLSPPVSGSAGSRRLESPYEILQSQPHSGRHRAKSWGGHQSGFLHSAACHSTQIVSNNTLNSLAQMPASDCSRRSRSGDGLSKSDHRPRPPPREGLLLKKESIRDLQAAAMVKESEGSVPSSNRPRPPPREGLLLKKDSIRDLQAAIKSGDELDTWHCPRLPNREGLILMEKQGSARSVHDAIHPYNPAVKSVLISAKSDDLSSSSEHNPRTAPQRTSSTMENLKRMPFRPSLRTQKCASERNLNTGKKQRLRIKQTDAEEFPAKSRSLSPKLDVAPKSPVRRSPERCNFESERHLTTEERSSSPHSPKVTPDFPRKIVAISDANFSARSVPMHSLLGYKFPSERVLTPEEKEKSFAANLREHLCAGHFGVASRRDN